MAHITTWESEALEHLPLIMRGGRPPKYVTYGGIDAFNAQKTDEKRSLPLAEVRRQMDETHKRLLAFIRSAPSDQFAHETRARRRLRLDAYGHYALHARAIREWRARPESEPRP
jgi:DinB family protein